MIDRYSRPEMKRLWSDQARYERWFEVELAVLQVLGRQKIIPTHAAFQIKKKAKVKVRRILKLEATLKHDVIAFTTSIAEQVGPLGRYFHYGLTSSDVVDTALAINLREALRRISVGLEGLEQVLKKLALRYRNLPCMGRTHGVHAEPTSFGLKFLGFLVEVRRSKERLCHAIDTMSYGKLSGAVGAYGALSPVVEKQALALLKLKPEPVSTQVLPRDRHAEVFCVLAQIGSSLERIAVELRHLQRTEVHEIEEDFSTGQKGSSAMPHKKNPISAENIAGCSRLLRGYALSALENVALWHERDISHSSVERVIAPDATILLDYMIHRLTVLLKNLNVKKENIERNLWSSYGIFFSGHVLLALVRRGLSREEAYAIVQQCAHQAWQQQRSFQEELWEQELVRKLFSKQEFSSLFNVKNYLKNVDKIYGRV